MSQENRVENNLTRTTPHTAHPTPFVGLEFAVYARKSTEDARTEDHRSTARQVEQATRYVEQRGGAVLPDQVFVDEDASGAEFRNRPGLLRLLDAVAKGRPFNALVMSDRDRLGREQFRRSMVLQQIRDAGIRVFAYLDDEEIRLDDATEKLMESVKGYAAEMERERARLRGRDVAERKARQGHVTGGQPYGYINVRMKGGQPAAAGERHDYVKRVIEPGEAAVVRGMFRMCAAGWGFAKIAKTMNGVPEYAAQAREFFGGQRVSAPRTGSWAPPAVRTMLHNPLYRGEIIWGRTTHTDRDGRARLTTRRPAREWLRHPAPELQIVPDDLWADVQAHLKRQAEKFAQPGAGRVAAPDLRREGHYLLTGLARCGLCGWSLSIIGGKVRRYACGAAWKRGVCDNNLSQRVDLVEAAFLDTLEQEVLTPERFREALESGVAHVREQLVHHPDRRPTLEREKATLMRRIENMVQAIGDGRGPAALVQAIAKAEGRIKEIEAELRRLASVPALGEMDVKRIERDVAQELSRFGDLLKGDVPQARQALKQVLVDRVEFRPVDLGNGKRTYAFRGELSYGAVLHGGVSLQKFPLGV